MIVVNVLCASHLVITWTTFAILYSTTPWRLAAFGNAMGIISAVVAALQYAPQVWTTWRLRHIGSVSTPWLLIQTPGGLAAMPAQVNRPGTNWTTWLSYLGTFLGQFILLVICCCWAWRDWKVQKMRDIEAGVYEPWTWSNWHWKLWRWIWE